MPRYLRIYKRTLKKFKIHPLATKSKVHGDNMIASVFYKNGTYYGITIAEYQRSLKFMFTTFADMKDNHSVFVCQDYHSFSKELQKELNCNDSVES